MVTWLVMTDGRSDCIRRTIPQAEEQLLGPIAAKVIHDDSGDPEYRAWLEGEFPSFTVIGGPERRGFGGAIQSAWSFCRVLPGQYVFHLEDDFSLEREVDLTAMREVLDSHPYLVQLALLRQAVNESERAAGGVIEQHPDEYERKSWDGHAWLEHQLFFTTNPSLYRVSLCGRGWPDGSRSEGIFGVQLFAEQPKFRCGFWGEGVSVRHFGERQGVGY